LIVAAALENEGDRRLEAKVERIKSAAAASGLSQALYESLMEALGYGGNAAPMLALARALRWDRLRAQRDSAADPRFELEASLLGAAGLLPTQRGHHGPVEPYAVRLERAFATKRQPALQARIWKLWGVRPVNMPMRRIAAAAALLQSLHEPSDLLMSLAAGEPGSLVSRFISLRARGYWLNHHDLCAGPSQLPPAFIGRARALEIVLNVLIPGALATGDAGLAEQGLRWWKRLPRPASYGSTRFIENALASEGVRIPLNARRAQGLLALSTAWCAKNGCGRCPLS
jgi:hypothetical protein